MEFKEQIKHPKWQKKRLDILERDEYICQNCHVDDETLHVHHFTYKSNTNLWDYDNNNLITFCERCHKDWHTVNEKIKILLSVDTTYLKEVYALLKYVRQMDMLEISHLTKTAKEIVHDRLD